MPAPHAPPELRLTPAAASTTGDTGRAAHESLSYLLPGEPRGRSEHAAQSEHGVDRGGGTADDADDDAALEDGGKRRLIHLTAVVTFACFFGTMGAESMTALMLKDMFGVRPAESYSVFLVFGLISLVMPGVAFACFRRFNLATLAVGWCALVGAGFVACVSWAHLTQSVSLGAYVAGMSLAIGGITIAVMAHQALLSVRLPAEEQAVAAPLLASVGQAARALGPPVLSSAYGGATWLSPGSGPNVTILLTLGLACAALLLPQLTARELCYGAWADPPFVEPERAEGSPVLARNRREML